MAIVPKAIYQFNAILISVLIYEMATISLNEAAAQVKPQAPCLAQ